MPKISGEHSQNADTRCHIGDESVPGHSLECDGGRSIDRGGAAIHRMKTAFAVLAIIGLAAVPCAWDSRDIRDASWLPAVVSTLTGKIPVGTGGEAAQTPMNGDTIRK